MANLDEMMQKAKQKKFRRPDEIVRANILAANEEKLKLKQEVNILTVSEKPTVNKLDTVDKKETMVISPTVATTPTVSKSCTVDNIPIVDNSLTVSFSPTVITMPIVSKSDTMNKTETVAISDTVYKTPTVTKKTTVNKSPTVNKKPFVAPTITDKSGYMQITNRIIETLYLDALSERKIRVLLFVVRRTIGWRQESVILSASDFKSSLGYDNSTIWKVITPLVEDGYLISSATGGGKANCYSLNPKKFGKLLVSDTVTDLATVPKNDTVEDSTMDKTNTMDKKTTVTVGDLTTVNCGQIVHSAPYINTDINTDLNTLSLSAFLKAPQLAELETRWISFLKKEREREENRLFKLMKQKPDEAETILKAFQLVIKDQEENGQIKSAIAVLETNYSAQYRARAIASIAKHEQKQNEAHTSTQEKTKHEEQEDAEAKRELIRMQCFQQAFPNLDNRKAYIAAAFKDNAMFSKFGVDSPIAIGNALWQWANNEGYDIIEAAHKRATSKVN